MFVTTICLWLVKHYILFNSIHQISYITGYVFSILSCIDIDETDLIYYAHHYITKHN